MQKQLDSEHNELAGATVVIRYNDKKHNYIQYFPVFINIALSQEEKKVKYTQ